MIIHNIEQRTPEWHALRAGKPTASEFSRIVTSVGEPSKQAAGYAMALAAELFTGKRSDAFEGNEWTERGRELEASALRFYTFARETDIEPVGFITDDDATMGCSPDGLVGEDGMVEIKCLKAETHIKAILYHQKHGRCPPDYVQQTQGQIMIAGRQWCDLFFYHPDLPPLIVRQLPDAKLNEALSRDIPLLLKERDAILAALRTQQAA